MSERTAELEQASRDEVKRRGQANALATLFRNNVGQPIGLPQVMKVGGCQYSARIHFLRHVLGLRITNFRKDGKSFFRLEKSVPRASREDVLHDVKHQVEEAHEPGFLFPREAVNYVDPEES
jgi:hypothetical protein